jgi:predicted DNA-binding transcriptional regulator AlpA
MADLNPKHPGTLATRSTVAAILGISKQRVAELIARPSFPRPLDAPEGKPIWAVADIEAYKQFREWSGEGDPPTPESDLTISDDERRAAKEKA